MELRNLPYAQQEQVMMYILTRVPALVGAAFDATGNGGYLAEAALLAFGPDIIDACGCCRRSGTASGCQN